MSYTTAFFDYIGWFAKLWFRSYGARIRYVVLLLQRYRPYGTGKFLILLSVTKGGHRWGLLVVP